jgi:hypothetical protein
MAPLYLPPPLKIYYPLSLNKTNYMRKTTLLIALVLAGIAGRAQTVRPYNGSITGNAIIMPIAPIVVNQQDIDTIMIWRKTFVDTSVFAPARTIHTPGKNIIISHAQYLRNQIKTRLDGWRDTIMKEEGKLEILDKLIKQGY